MIRDSKLCFNQDCFRFDDRHPNQFKHCVYFRNCDGYYTQTTGSGKNG